MIYVEELTFDTLHCPNIDSMDLVQEFDRKVFINFSQDATKCYINSIYIDIIGTQEIFQS